MDDVPLFDGMAADLTPGEAPIDCGASVASPAPGVASPAPGAASPRTGVASPASSAPHSVSPASNPAPPRLRLVDRMQVRMMTCALDDLLSADHQARLVWRVVCALDLEAFLATVAARGSDPGRPATDPRILLTLWLYAALNGVGSGREIDRLCECHDAYRWIAGGVSLNYHTINAFRVGHGEALDDLLTQMIASLVKQGLVSVARIAQDGVRVRADAGLSSFRSESTLERLLEESRQHVNDLKQQNDPALSAQQRAKREADAQDREQRLENAVKQVAELRQQREDSVAQSGRSPTPARASTTDPQARVMKMADGGFRPAYNVQLAADVSSRAIVGVDVVNVGSDQGQATPMRQQIEERGGDKVKQHLVDGGYASLEAIDKGETAGVEMIAPVKQSTRPDVDPHARKSRDTDATCAWRQRMATDEARQLYKKRGATIETINGDLTEHRGLRRMPVRGSPKVKCVVLLLALAYNILHLGLNLLAAAVVQS